MSTSRVFAGDRLERMRKPKVSADHRVFLWRKRFAFALRSWCEGLVTWKATKANAVAGLEELCLTCMNVNRNSAN